jgi:hypothetical protein
MTHGQANSISYRRIFWVITIAYAIATILHAVLCKETYAPILLENKTKKL